MRTYLDHNASSALRPKARQAMIEALDLTGNPSSVHCEGRAARALVEAARIEIAELVNAEPKQIVFTSGGTEANNTALNPLAVQPVGMIADGSAESVDGGLEDCDQEDGDLEGAVEDAWRLLFASAIEHPSVRECLRNEPDEPTFLPVGSDGRIELAKTVEVIEQVFSHVSRVMAEGKPLFIAALMHANNETGVVQPVEEFADLVHHRNGLFHCDAIQSAGKMPLDFKRIGADFMALSAHKLGGPMGVGALVVARPDDVLVEPLISGGGQERRMRSGTENIVGIAGFAAAATQARSELEKFSGLVVLRDEIEARVLELTPAAIIVGRESPRLANTSCIILPGVGAESQVIGLDLEGIAVSSGAACSSGKVGRSHVLAAMGVSDDLARCAIRISLGWNTTRGDVERFVAGWRRLAERRCRRMAAE